jgi:hypothetical protein
MKNNKKTESYADKNLGPGWNFSRDIPVDFHFNNHKICKYKRGGEVALVLKYPSGQEKLKYFATSDAYESALKKLEAGSGARTLQPAWWFIALAELIDYAFCD